MYLLVCASGRISWCGFRMERPLSVDAKGKRQESSGGGRVSRSLWKRVMLAISLRQRNDGQLSCLNRSVLLLLLWYVLRGLSSSKGLIGGLSSIVQDKKDNRKERKTKRKKKIKKKEKKKNSSEDRRRKSQNRQEEGKKDAPVQNWKLKT